MEVAAATVLHRGDTLAAARCTLHHATSLYNQGGAEASHIEKAALRAEAWALASSILPHLSTRMDDNTLLPGRCSKEEVELYKRFTLGRRDIDNVPPLSARDLQLVGFCIGCAVALLAARQVLFQLFSDPRPSPTELAFVFRAVDTVRLSRHAACASSLMMLSIQMLPASRCLRAMNLGKECACFLIPFGV